MEYPASKILTVFGPQLCYISLSITILFLWFSLHETEYLPPGHFVIVAYLLFRTRYVVYLSLVGVIGDGDGSWLD